MKKSAVVVLSGGQDSVTCLGWALKKFDQVFAIGFDYAQKHKIELQQAKAICKKHDIPFAIMSIPALVDLGDSALVSTNSLKDKNVSAKHHRNPNLPASFVPNRNALFLTTAHAYAQKVGADTIITGVCETDFSGYPDCRQVFICSLEAALNIGYQTDIHIVTPLMYLDKAQTFALAEKVGFLQTVLEESHTCYNGDREHNHDWGYGCGECPACKLRAKGFAEYLESKEAAEMPTTETPAAGDEKEEHF
ncbi:queuosine biosynthesis ATPase [Shewanella phage S0112]|nr:queuosine biosynthesis ATPase [Shewanella phage S0112]